MGIELTNNLLRGCLRSYNLPLQTTPNPVTITGTDHSMRSLGTWAWGTLWHTRARTWRVSIVSTRFALFHRTVCKGSVVAIGHVGFAHHAGFVTIFNNLEASFFAVVKGFNALGIAFENLFFSIDCHIEHIWFRSRQKTRTRAVEPFDCAY